MTFQHLPNWQPPAAWLRITTLDLHTAGEPLRVVTGGFPDLPGETILARRRYARDHHDALRTALMGEPRGHREMYGCLLTPPVSPAADLGVLFLHNEGYSTMCGHAIIALGTLAVAAELVAVTEPETTVRIDTPAGLVTAQVAVEDGQPGRVRFQNVPSFVVERDAEVAVPGYGNVRYDLAFGGAFYAYVDAAQLGLTCQPSEYTELVAAGQAIKKAVAAARPMGHPFEDDLNFLYGTIFVAPPLGNADSRNVCIFADGQVDRSPTGTGVSGRVALAHARGTLQPGETLTVESILGTRFTGQVAEETSFGPYDAVIPEVGGTAHITGQHTFLLDPNDPLRDGFFL